MQIYNIVTKGCDKTSRQLWKCKSLDDHEANRMQESIIEIINENCENKRHRFILSRLLIIAPSKERLFRF